MRGIWLSRIVSRLFDSRATHILAGVRWAHMLQPPRRHGVTRAQAMATVASKAETLGREALGEREQEAFRILREGKGFRSWS